MSTVKQLRAVVEHAGGVLEEDGGSHCSRVFQAVAPNGKLWAGSDLKCLFIDWPTSGLPWTESGRAEAIRDVTSRVSFGLRDMTAQEREDYEEDAP